MQLLQLSSHWYAHLHHINIWERHGVIRGVWTDAGGALREIRSVAAPRHQEESRLTWRSPVNSQYSRLYTLQRAPLAEPESPRPPRTASSRDLEQMQTEKQQRDPFLLVLTPPLHPHPLGSLPNLKDLLHQNGNWGSWVCSKHKPEKLRRTKLLKDMTVDTMSPPVSPPAHSSVCRLGSL